MSKRIVISLLLIFTFVICVGCRPQIEIMSTPIVQISEAPDSSAPSDSPFTATQRLMDCDTLCLGEEGSNPEVVQAVNVTLLTIPRWLRYLFFQSDWEFLVVVDDIATTDYPDQFVAGEVLGSTSYRNRIIKIQNEMRAAANTPVHEMGHWLDAYLGYPTLNDSQFEGIYLQEGNQYRETFGPTCSWSVQEFFAEGFWCYWKSPNALQKACPLFYSYLENVLSAAKGSLGDMAA